MQERNIDNKKDEGQGGKKCSLLPWLPERGGDWRLPARFVEGKVFAARYTAWKLKDGHQ